MRKATETAKIPGICKCHIIKTTKRKLARTGRSAGVTTPISFTSSETNLARAYSWKDATDHKVITSQAGTPIT